MTKKRIILCLALHWLLALTVSAATATYDTEGRLVRMTYADGSNIDYPRDSNGNQLDRIVTRPVELTITVDPPGSGTVTGAGRYPRNTQQSLTATAGSAFVFAAWKRSDGTVLSITPNYTHPLNATETLTAKFVPNIPEIAIEDPSTTPATDLVDGVASLSFGSQLLQSTTTKILTIRNTGNAPLTGLNLTVDGSASADFSTSTLPASIPTGGSATLTIQFIPTALGTRSAALHIASNDADETFFDISISGTGSPLNVNYTTRADIPITSNGYNATSKSVSFTLDYAPAVGTQLVVINNTGLGFISGTFSNLAQGQAVDLVYNRVTYSFVANYFGGTGNDLVLQWANTRMVQWGYNYSGQLGNNSTTNSPVPVAVNTTGMLSGKTLIAVSTGGNHNLALCSDGTVVGWGHNGNFQLGYNSTTPSLVPVTVPATGALVGKAVIAVSAGAQHSMALCSDGTVVAWGSNSAGQLGNNSLTQSAVPVAVNTAAVLAGKTVIAISAGTYYSLALCSDGTVAAWGFNEYGQLGNNSTASSPIPVAVNMTGVLAGKTVIAISAGVSHNLALCSDGTVAAWGHNSFRQLGNNSTTNSPVPVAVNTTGLLAGKTVVAISAGTVHSLALCSDGTMVTWGSNSSGLLGNNSTTNSPVPVAVNATGVLAGKTVISFSSGNSHNLALCSDGTLTAWGGNDFGQLGNGTTTTSPVPVLVSNALLGSGERFVASATGTEANHNNALIASPPTFPGIIVQESGNTLVDDASFISFGSQLLQTATTKILTIRNTGLSTLSGLSVAIDGSAASDFTKTSVPASIAPGSSETISIRFVPTTIGARSAAIHITSTNTGESSFDLSLQGTGTQYESVTFTQGLIQPFPINVPITAAGYTASGKILSVILNFPPRPGTILSLVNNTSTTPIDGSFISMPQGSLINLTWGTQSYPFAINYFGGDGNDIELVWAATDLVAWGANHSGQLGDGTTTNRLAPVNALVGAAPLDDTWLSTAVGEGHSLALTAEGHVYAWGMNDKGQLGDGTTVDRSTPVAVIASGILLGKTVVAIAAGQKHSVALTSDGKIYAWGANDVGQLGDLSESSRSAPVAVYLDGDPSHRPVTAISAGKSHSLALLSDGDVLVWGSNIAGSLGLGVDEMEASYTTEPLTLSGMGALAGKRAIALSAGTDFSLALREDHKVIGWGANDVGQLGDGTTTRRLEPTLMPISGTFRSICAGGSHAMAQEESLNVRVWGANTNGQLGIGNGLNQILPTYPYINLVQWIRTLAAGASHTSFLVFDGTLNKFGRVWASGRNASGQLGTGDGIPSLIPAYLDHTHVLENRPVMSLARGPAANHMVAIVANRQPLPDIAVFGTAGSIVGEIQDDDLLDFGFTSLGGEATRTIMIQNVGEEYLTGVAYSFGGNAAAEFSITPSPIALAPGMSATAVLHFSPSFAATRTATLHIASNDADENPFDITLTGFCGTPAESWRQQYFGTAANTGDAADAATPQHDGIPNLIKFATGMDPTKTGRNPGAATRVGGTITFTYIRSKAAVLDGVTIKVEWSDTLAENSWSNTEVSETSVDQGATELVTATLPAGSSSKRFVRLRVSRP
jgi:alpha-tubulin suppressor-like RCC1 family protein